MSSTTEILLQYVTHTQFATLGARVQEELRALYGRGAWSGYNVNLHSLSNEAVHALRGLEPPPAPQTPAVPRRRRVVLNPEDTDSEDEWPAAPPGATAPLGLAANLGPPPQDTTEQNNALNYAQEGHEHIYAERVAYNYANQALESTQPDRRKLLENARVLMERTGQAQSIIGRRVLEALRT